MIENFMFHFSRHKGNKNIACSNMNLKNNFLKRTGLYVFQPIILCKSQVILTT